MSPLWKDIKKTLKEGVSIAAEKTEEYTKIGKVKVEILNVKRNIDKTFAELGQEAYDLIKKDKTSPLAQNDKIKKLTATIEDLKKSLKEKEAEIETIKKEAIKKGEKPKKKKSIKSSDS